MLSTRNSLQNNEIRILNVKDIKYMPCKHKSRELRTDYINIRYSRLQSKEKRDKEGHNEKG